MMRLLEAELHFGERLVWCQQPRALAFVPATLPEFLFGIPFSVVPASILYLALSQWHQAAWSLLLVVLSFAALFLVIGIGLLLSPFWAYWKGARTIYAVTDERCIVIAAPYRRTVCSYLAEPEAGDIVNLHRTEDEHGHGDLVFHTQAVHGKRGIGYHDIGFIKLRDVCAAEDKLRELIATRQSTLRHGL